MRGFVMSIAACGLGLLALSTSEGTATATPAQTPDARAYVVFFENNAVTLTPEGREIVKAAADRARRSHSALVTISAPMTHVVAGYNPGMATPRLASVQRELIANGVSSNHVAQGVASDAALVPLVGAERVEIRVMPKAMQST